MYKHLYISISIYVKHKYIFDMYIYIMYKYQLYFYMNIYQ